MEHETFVQTFPSKELFTKIFRQFRRETGLPLGVVCIANLVKSKGWLHPLSIVIGLTQIKEVPRRQIAHKITAAFERELARNSNLRGIQVIRNGRFTEEGKPFSNCLISHEKVLTEAIDRALVREFIACLLAGYNGPSKEAVYEINGNNVFLKYKFATYEELCKEYDG